MGLLKKLLNSLDCLYLKLTTVALVASGSLGVAEAETIWAGDFETGNFLQWHKESSSTTANYSQIPAYGRPPKAAGEGDGWPDSYYGDGSLLEIVTKPIRQGKYAAKFTVKNSLNGVEPDDCDVPFPTCDRRRTELTVQGTLPRYYDAMPYMSERWISVSHYLPADWNTTGSGWGPTVFQIKPLNESGASPNFAIELNGDTWSVWHRWSDEGGTIGQVPWQQQMFYAGDEDGSPYPRTNMWPDGMAHFPDVEDSYAALQSVNIGGWTDWVIHVKFDARGDADGGDGFLRVWKREDSGAWVQVLDIFPGEVTRGGMTFDHGIGFNQAATDSNPGGFGVKAGMYMHADSVWNLNANRVIYIDNVKVGSNTSTFATMSPDGSSPGTAPRDVSPPKPPTLEGGS